MLYYSKCSKKREVEERGKDIKDTEEHIYSGIQIETDEGRVKTNVFPSLL